MVNNKKNAITLIEIIVSISISAIILTMLFGTITKRTIKNATAAASSGQMLCYKDLDGKLHMRVTSGKKTITKDNMESCNYEFPSGVSGFKVTLVGGGGGGGKPSAEFVTKNVNVNNFVMFNNVKDSNEYSITNCKTNCVVDYNTSKTSLSSKPGVQIPTELKPYLSYAGFKKHFMLGHPVTIQSGSVKKFYEIDQNFLNNFTESTKYYLQSSSENKGCTAAVDVDGTDMLSCTGIAVFCIYNNSSVCNKQIVLGPDDGATANKEESKLPTFSYSFAFEQPHDKFEVQAIDKAYAIAGNGGEAGETKYSTSLDFAGQTIQIPASSIGNGGEPGKDGGDTSFPSHNITAKGGAAGSTTKIACDLDSFSKDDLTESSRRKLCVASEKMDSNAFNGKKSLYVTDTSSFSNFAATKKIAGNGSKCSKSDKECKICYSTNCSDDASANPDAYGSGGGGGDSMIIYDNILKFHYTVENYLEPRYPFIEKDIISDKDNFINQKNQYLKDAGHGAGGAIIIQWGL